MLKGILVVLLLVIIGFFAMLVYKAHLSKQGKALGLQSGVLALCSDKPNCVCSEAQQQAKNTDLFIEPIPFKGTSAEVMPRLKQELEAMGGVVVAQETNYLAATFTSKVFGFVDDVELRFDESAGLVHVRSASRQGYSDLGANRKRMEQFKQQLTKG